MSDTLSKFSVFNDLIEGVQVIDTSFSYVYVNEAVAKHAKLKRGDLEGKQMMELFPGIEKTQMFQKIKSCFSTGETQNMLNVFDFPDESKGYFELRMQRIPEGVLIMSIDITPVMRANEMLESSKERLEKEVEKRTKEILSKKKIIEDQVADLKRLGSTKDKFFAIVAHDLKAPLNSFLGFSELLIEGLDHDDLESIRVIGAELKKAAQNLVRLIENLFTWAKIQMNEVKAKRELLSINELAQQCFDNYQSTANLKKIDFQLELPEEDLLIFGDSNHIAFMLRNLCNNALKFTPPGGKVSLAINQTPDAKVCVQVSDTGIGVPDELKPKLFTIEALESRSGTAGEKGSGLGLLLVKEFLALNDGVIDLESEVGKGSKFILQFPKHEPSVVHEH
ncbi:MAG: ATP-binding protein [Luteibaculum sp.]